MEAEKKLCITALGLDNSEILVKKPSSDIRGKLRSQAYNDWCQLRLHGKGVILYDQYPQANSWVTSRLGLTSAEWRDAIKLQGNLAPVRALHGRSQDNTRCRHCNEPETLPHVLGFCHYGELLRNNRHHLIRSTIAAALTKTGRFEVYEEVHCIATNGSTRRVDIIAIDRDNKTGYILDPTVRFETSLEQPENVNKEKQLIYEPTAEYFKTSYNLEIIAVIGLFIGSRGTITKQFFNFCTKFQLPKKICTDIALLALKSSIQILRYHLYHNAHIS